MSVPHAIKLQNEKGKEGVVNILAESQGLPEGDLLGFMLKRFPTNHCLVTSQNYVPFKTDKQPGTIPWACVIGLDGTLLYQGNPAANLKKFDEAIENELKKLKAGWGTSPEAKKARALAFYKGNLADALATLDAADKSANDAAKTDLAAARAEIEARYESRKKAFRSLLEQGRFLDAQKAANELARGVKGRPEWETEAATLVSEFQKPDVDKELKLDKDLAKIIASFGDKAPTDAHAASFKAFAKKNQGTKVAARAEVYATACTFQQK